MAEEQERRAAADVKREVPQFQEDDDMANPVSGAKLGSVLIVGLVLFLVLGALFCSSGCASANDKAGDVALATGAAGLGSVAGGPILAMIFTGVVALWNAATGGTADPNIVGLTWGGRVGDFFERWAWWLAIVAIAYMLSRRFRNIVKLAFTGLWRLVAAWRAGNSERAKEAALDVVQAPLRVVGLAAEDNPERAYEKLLEKGLGEGWIEPDTWKRRPVPVGWTDRFTAKVKA